MCSFLNRDFCNSIVEVGATDRLGTDDRLFRCHGCLLVTELHAHHFFVTKFHVSLNAYFMKPGICLVLFLHDQLDDLEG